MPTRSDYTQLSITRMTIKAVSWRGEIIRREGGGGYFNQATVGLAGGLHKFYISASILPDDSNLGTISGSAWFDYYYDFYIARTTGAVELFWIRWNDLHWHVRFAETEMSFDKFKGDLYGAGVELEQRRAFGVTYNAGGDLP